MSDPFAQRRPWVAERIYERAHLTGEFQLRSGELSGEYFDLPPGGGVIESSRKLRQQGASIVTVLCVIDRDAGGAANLRAAGLEMRSLFMVSELERLGQSSRGTRVPTVQIRGVARHVRDARVSSVVP